MTVLRTNGRFLIKGDVGIGFFNTFEYLGQFLNFVPSQLAYVCFWMLGAKVFIIW